MLASLERWRLRFLYVASLLMRRPSRALLNKYYHAFPDIYQMERNGPARFDAIAAAIRANVADCRSLLDVACYEGLALAHVARTLGVSRVTGLDISDVVLARAAEACRDLDATFHPFDLSALYDDPCLALPVPPGSHDVILVCEVLYMVGDSPHRLWENVTQQMDRKIAFLTALQRQAGKAVIVQHFGRSVRDPIGAVVEAAGGRQIDEEWGIYLLDGKAATGT